MKSSAKVRLAALAAAVALALVAAPEARAGKQYNAASLKGAYHFTLVEITVTNDVPSETIYCNGYGRLVFDGVGIAEVVDGYGLCSDGEQAIYTSEFDYTVSPDGEVYLYESGGSETHCQLADNGALLLCDGTGDTGEPAPSERKLWMVTAGKL
jgi:hypothetical protein